MSLNKLTLCREIINKISSQQKEEKEVKDNKWLEQTFFKMIKSGEIKAKIDAEKQMISFIDTQSTNANSEEGREQEYIDVIEVLESQNQRIVDLMNKMEEMDTNLKLSIKF